MGKKQVSRRVGLDIFKGICVFFVVCIHTTLPGIIGGYLISLTRVAVPFFFMVTGFFFSDIKKRGKEIKQISKIFKLFLMANLIYFGWNIIIYVIQKEPIDDLLKKSFSFASLVKFILFNESPWGGHLWYLGAILYVLILVFLIKKALRRTIAFRTIKVVIFLLLLMDIIFGKYSLIVWNREFPLFCVRNFIFVGLPYFLIGVCIQHYKYEIPNNTLVFLIILFSFTTFLERFLLIKNSVNATRDHYISTTFLVIVLFLYFSKTCWNNCNKLCWLKNIGERYSTGIYIIHPIVIFLLDICCINIFQSTEKFLYIYKILKPFLVYFLSWECVWLFKRVLSYRK